MNNLKVVQGTKTLVDVVEEKLRTYFEDNGFVAGDSIPSELVLAKALGVGRSVLREAISRLRMIGLVQSRTRRGMVLSEPDLSATISRVLNPKLIGKQNILDIIGLRIALEIGCAEFIFRNVTDEDIKDLEEIINQSTPVNNIFSPENDAKFHKKLYEISKNRTLINFQSIFLPLFIFARENLHKAKTDQDKKKIQVNHTDLLNKIKEKDISGYQRLMTQHLELYFDYIYN